MTKSARRLTVSDKLLLAAYQLESAGRSPFTAEDLVVMAWKRFPNTFGLGGYHDSQGDLTYPDSNRVFVEIMGSKPIRNRGYLEKTGTKMYALTQSGRDFASRMRDEGSTEKEIDRGGAKSGLARDMKSQLKRLITSNALRKVDNGQIDELTFHDACIFWGITPQSFAIELKGRFANLKNIIDSAKKVLRDGEARFEHDGKPFSAATLELIEETHNGLARKFAEEIQTIERRIDQRNKAMKRKKA